jgi:hypothetical protein
MSANLKIVEFPVGTAESVPDSLRTLADSIEKGNFGTGHNVAWVVDCGGGRVEVGLSGKAASRGAEAYLLLGMGQRRLEQVQ